MFSLADEFAKKTPTNTQVQYREESRHMSRDTYSSVSSNTVRNFSIGLHKVPQHVQEVALQTGRRCHGHRSPFPAGCRSRTVLDPMVMNASWNVLDISPEEMSK